MAAAALPTNAAPGLWGVFLLFLDPVGAGIPAGVLLAKSRGIAWPITAFLYFLSDWVLALSFEPFVFLFSRLGRVFPLLQRFAAATAAMTERAAERYGGSGPLTLILVSFGIDPMTGRAAAKMAGHGFFSGWLLAILGDMLYFLVIMSCTLWLSSVLGDGTVATLVILVLMIAGPSLFRRWRERGLPATA